ncbi:hypothetical protein ACTFIU_003236 [Dictyostelium citrinum]
MISSSFQQEQYLRVDIFDDDQCSRESVYSSQWVKLNFCNGQYVYRYVPNLGEGSTTTTASATGNPLTTANTLSSVDITSIVTQAVTLGMTGVGGLTNTGLLSIGALNVDNLVNAADASQGDNQNTATTSQSPLPSSDQSTTTTSTTTTTTTQSSSSSVLTNSGLLTIGGTTVSAVTDFVTSIISSSLTNIGTTGATTSVQSGMGSVVQYYCLSASGCLTQCVSLKTLPIGICTKNKLDNVVYSVVNGTDMIVKIDNTTNPGPNNGYCQSFTSPSACVSANTESTQYMNNHCGKGLKINCTSSVYNSYTCVDSTCLQCSKSNSYPLDQCNLINSTSGVIFKSLLKNPITEEPTPLPSSSSSFSSSSNDDSSSSQHSSDSNHSIYKINNNSLMITIIFLSISLIIAMV